MRLLKPGTWPWLLAHELRVLWRSFGVRSRIIAVLGIVFVLLAHVGGYLMAASRALHVLMERSPASAIVITLFVGLLVLSSAFGLASRVLLERGDLDLLLAAPVTPAAIYTVRALTVAVASVGSMALFLLPLANMGPFAGDWAALAAWPALASLGLASAAIALAVTLALARVLGVRRARMVSQLVGAFVGIGFVMAMQVEPLLSAPHRRMVRAWLQGEAQRGGWLGAESPLLWPMRAFVGEPLALAAMAAVGVAAFVAVIRGTQDAFLRAMQEPPQGGRIGARRAAASRPFRSGLARVVLAKELTLVRRDPALMARALLQLLYLVPLFIVMIRRGQPEAVIGAALVALGASLASTLAWITVSGEEAPDLLRAAPVRIDRLRWLKVAAAVTPVVVVAAPFLLWFARESIATACIVALFLALALAAGAVVQVWSTPMGAGRDPRQRFRQNPFVSVADTLGSLAWAGACWLVLAGSAWALLAMALGCIAPAAAWRASRRERD